MNTRRIDEFQAQQPAIPPTPPRYTFAAFVKWAIGSTQRENNRLRELNTDLHAQLLTMRRAYYITKEEKESLDNIVVLNKKLNDEQNNVILWLRENQPVIFRTERYAGLSFSQMIIHLLGGKTDAP